MKAALVLSAASPSLRQQAGEINAMMETIAASFSSVELWMFYQDIKPEIFPEVHDPLSAVKLIKVEHRYSPEFYLQALQHLMGQYPMDLLVFASDGSGVELATRLAFRLNGSSCVQVLDCDFTSGRLRVKKPVYGNNLTAQFILESSPYCLSVAKQACQPANMIPCEFIETEIFPLNQPRFDWLKDLEVILDQSDSGLADADRVLVLGQGAKNKETIDVLQGVANTLGAELGASRQAVMNAWIDMNRLIGVSGLIISPKLCIAAGVSGTGVFSVGIKSSGFIVAINIDGKAPIFQIADIGIVGDLKEVLLELEKVIISQKTKKRTS
ncbi:electron transfer flavoprotein subunit alpha/FixB family protein [Desulfobacula sp.]